MTQAGREQQSVEAAELSAEPVHADLLRQFLSEQDVPCPRCQYNLRQLQGDHCPECGDRLQLQVGLVEAKMGAYVLLIAAACAGFGASLLFMAVALVYAPSSWWRKSSAMVLWALLIGSGAILAATLPNRLRFRRASRSTQWRLAIGSVVFVVCAMVGFVALFGDN